MKTIKKVAIIAGCLIAAPFIAALFVPRSYTISVSEIIAKPKEDVYNYVKILDNQKKYSIWLMDDPGLNPAIINKDGTIGAIQRWNSKIEKVGEGEQEITGMTPDRIDIDLRFKRPFEGHAKAANIFKSVSENKSQLISEFYSNETYPLNLPSYLFGRKMVEEAQKKNLKNIKAILENQ